jgi:ParB-like chromosome segregation protein Spo0J
MSTIEMKSPQSFAVHPAAEVFPLIDGEAFERLVESIRKHGVQNPVVYSGNTLLDGRNRIRAVERLAAEGVNVLLPCTEWDGYCEMSAVEWITAQNLDRRHLTEDARAMIGAELARIIKAEAKKAKKDSQFNSDTGKAAASKKATPAATADSPSPQKRDRKKSEERTTAAQAAKKAKVSTHKMKQAMAVDKAVEAGEIAPEVVQEIKAGKKKVKDALPANSKKKPINRDYASIDDQIRVEANRAWMRLRGKFTPGDEHKKLRAVMAEIVRNEQKQFEKK